MSAVRKIYFGRLFARIGVLISCIAARIKRPEWFDVLEGWSFFDEFSPLHLLWFVWMGDMLTQLFPIGNKIISIGSRKVFKQFFRPAENMPSVEKLTIFSKKAKNGAVRVLIIWSILIAVLCGFYHRKLLDTAAMLLISAAFYVCDLICVLIWCPFRLIMGTRCCTTCRIFNWDHMMMFTPMLPVAGFFSVSLIVMSFVVLFFWEYRIKKYPELFWEGTNKALRCSECTDKLCTQYCGRKNKTVH